MGKVSYSMGVSLDGYFEDADGNFEWSRPDAELHRIANQEARQSAAFLFGRHLYELMEGYWPAADGREDLPAVEAEFARIYVSTPRIVFSDTLERAADGVRIVRSADAIAEARRLKEETEGLLAVGGAGLATSLIDLIDEFRLFVHPILVGGGKRFFPPVSEKLSLRLAENRTLSSGAVYLRYERT